MKYTTRLSLVAFSLSFSLFGKNIPLVPRVPAGFEQSADAQKFSAKGLRYEAVTSPSGFRVLLRGKDNEARTVGMSILNGNVEAPARPLDKLPLKTTYLVGKREDWRTSVNTFRRLRYDNVLPGIDIEYRPTGDQLEFDFILKQGADPSGIVLRYDGQDGMEIDALGNLVVSTGGLQFTQEIPAIYQRIGGSLHLVSGRYALDAHGDVRFILGPYDTTHQLVIDPVISYSGFVSATGATVANSFGRDAQGRWYVAGTTGAGDLPVAGNAPQNARNGDLDGYVMRIDPNYPGGPMVTDLTYFGGSGADEIRAMAVDATGVAYITGVTQSSNLPVTSSANQNTIGGDRDVFFAKIDLGQPAANALVYLTYLGGSALDVGTAIQVDGSGNAYLTGYTASTNFPTAGSPYQSTDPAGWDAFLVQYDSAGKLAYSSYLGGAGTDMGRALALASDGTVIVAGTTYSSDFPMAGNPVNSHYEGGGGDAFVAKISLASGLVYSTFLGGSGGEDLKAVAINGAGQIVVSGWTLSQDFPITAGAYQSTLRGGTDVFVSVLDLTQSGPAALVYSTMFGGSNSDLPYGMTIDATGQVLLTGYTYSSVDFPTTPGAFQSTAGGAVDAFIARLDPSKQGAEVLVSSTYLGGAGNDYGYSVDLDENGTMYIVGSTSSRQFPNVVSADPRQTRPGNSDAFILSLQP